MYNSVSIEFTFVNSIIGCIAMIAMSTAMNSQDGKWEVHLEQVHLEQERKREKLNDTCLAVIVVDKGELDQFGKAIRR